MTTATATILQFNRAPTTGATDRNATLTTASTAAAKMAAFAAHTRSRPLPEPDELPLPPTPPPAPAPAPRPTPAPRPAPSADPSAAVVKAFRDGPDPQKTITELVELTGLRRGEVLSTVAALANAGRAMREITDVLGALTVRWSLKG